MEGASEVILRNAHRLPTAPLLLVNAPRDGLSLALQGRQCAVRHSTQDFGDCVWLHSGGVEARFEAVPSLVGDEALVVLFLPREKERLVLLLHALAAQLGTQARLWLVGENRAGIRSAGRHLERFFDTADSLDKARHCGLYEAIRPRHPEVFALEHYLTDWQARYGGHEVRLRSLPGVFAHGRLDAGTRLLLQALAPLRPRGRILDFACGSGVVGLALGLSAQDADVTLLDNSALALESTRQGLRANGMAGRLLPSDGLSEVRGKFDWIVSNPPFHRGIRNDLDVASAFFAQAGYFLTERGKMVVVFNRHLPYFGWLEQAFARIERLAANRDFLVVQASQPAS